MWKYLRRELDRAYQVIHWHYRGHGRSPAPRDPERIGIADLADDLASVLDDVETGGVRPDDADRDDRRRLRVVVMGHSMGVQVALEFYRRHRTRVAGLVLLNGAASNPLRSFRGRNDLERLLPRLRAAVDRAPRVFGYLSRALVPTRLSYRLAAHLEINGRLLDVADFMPYLEGLGRVHPRLFLAMVARAGEHSAEDLLPHIEVPTLVVSGERDGFTPPYRSREIAEAIPGAQLLTVEHGSHTAPIERPHFVNAAILEFLAGIP